MKYLTEHYDLTKVPMAGASGGALASVLAACGVPADRAFQRAYDLSLTHGIWDRPLGLVGVWGALIEEWLDDLLPDDAAERCRCVEAECVRASSGRGRALGGQEHDRLHAVLVHRVPACERAPMRARVAACQPAIAGIRDWPLAPPLVACMWTRGCSLQHPPTFLGAGTWLAAPQAVSSIAVLQQCPPPTSHRDTRSRCHSPVYLCIYTHAHLLQSQPRTATAPQLLTRALSLFLHGRHRRGRVTIIVTTLPNMGQVGISDFTDKKDLINAAMASSHIPLLLDLKFARSCRGKLCVDGSFPGAPAPGARHAGVCPGVLSLYDDEYTYTSIPRLQAACVWSAVLPAAPSALCGRGAPPVCRAHWCVVLGNHLPVLPGLSCRPSLPRRPPSFPQTSSTTTTPSCSRRAAAPSSLTTSRTPTWSARVGGGPAPSALCCDVARLRG